MYKLVDFKSYQPTLARPNSDGKITVKARMRASLSKFFFQDRVTPVTALELAEAQSHHDHSPAIESSVTEAEPAKKAVAKKPAAKKAAAKPAAKKTATKKAAPKKK